MPSRKEATEHLVFASLRSPSATMRAIACWVSSHRSRSEAASACAAWTFSVTFSMRLSTVATMPGAGSSSPRAPAVKPSRRWLASGVLSALTAPKPQWWLVTIKPSLLTNDAVQPLICTVADRTPPFSGCQNSSLVISIPRSLSAAQSISRTWVGSHWPSSGSRVTAARTVRNDRNMPSHIRGTRLRRDRLA